VRIAITATSILLLVSVGLALGPGSAAAADGNVTGTTQTDYFIIEYTEGNQAEAERVATFADDYYEVLFQRFGVKPVNEKIPVRVLDRETLDCSKSDATGCYKSGVEGRIYVTSDDRSVFYHELTHRFQARAMEGGTFINPPGSIQKFDVFVEGTARYMDSPATDIAADASFQEEEIDMTTKDVSADGYDDLALFSEFILHEYGREGFDMLYNSSDPRDVATLSDGDYPALVDEFYGQLPEQRSRMQSGGAPLVGFTYDPFLPAPGDEVTFDARTPDSVEELDRSWYNGEASSYEWDFDGDGEIDATGPTVTRPVADPANTTVTLYVTVDGERRTAEQRLLDSSMALERSAVEPVFRLADVTPGKGLRFASDLEADRKTIAGTSVTLNATVENAGIVGSEQVDVTLGDRSLGSQTVALEGGERRRVKVSGTVPRDLEVGTYDLEVSVGNRTITQTVRVDRPTYNIDWQDVRIPNGTEGWRANRIIKPGKRVEVQVEAQNSEWGPEIERPVRLYAGDELVGKQQMTFGDGEDVVFEFTAPEDPGALHIRGVVPPEAGFNEGNGFNVRFEVREQVSNMRIQVPEGKGGCTLSVTDVSVDGVYQDGEWHDPENVTEIRPDDAATIEITTMRNGSCPNPSLHPELTIDNESVHASPRFFRKYRFDIEYSPEEPGEHEIRYRDTLLDTITVAAPDSDTATDSTETGENESQTGSDDDAPPQSPSESDSADNSSSGTPGFGISVSVVALLVWTLASTWRRR